MPFKFILQYLNTPEIKSELIKELIIILGYLVIGFGERDYIFIYFYLKKNFLLMLFQVQQKTRIVPYSAKSRRTVFDTRMSQQCFNDDGCVSK